MKRVKVRTAEPEAEQLHPVGETPIYEPIDGRYLVADSKIGFDIYVQDDTAYVLFYTKGATVDEPLLTEIKLKRDFFVLSEDIKAYYDYVNDNIREIIENPDLPLNERSKALYNSTSTIVESMFEDPHSPVNLKRSERAIIGVIDIVLRNEKALLSLMKVTAHDYQTHTHCINVAIYAITIAQGLGYDAEALFEIGTAAMLHDLGKTQVDRDIINKNGRLTTQEYAQMKIHAYEGYSIAQELGIHNERILRGIWDHHEKRDGSGYPKGLEGDAISRYGQIIAICDVFDALTTERSYKKALSTFEALKLMKDHFSTHLNMEILNHFIRYLYTIGHEEI